MLAAPAAIIAGPDRALAVYSDVMDRHSEVEASEDVDLTARWCAEEEEALADLAFESPGDLAALLSRVVVLVDRLEYHSLYALEAGEQALARRVREAAKDVLTRL